MKQSLSFVQKQEISDLENVRCFYWFEKMGVRLFKVIFGTPFFSKQP